MIKYCSKKLDDIWNTVISWHVLVNYIKNKQAFTVSVKILKNSNDDNNYFAFWNYIQI